MKLTIYFTFLLSSFFGFSQNKFIFKENGLTPKVISSNIVRLTENEIHKKSLEWIKITPKNINLASHLSNNNNTIYLNGLEDNAIRVGKQFYHLKYTVKIRFEQGKYNFEPILIQTKLNSKYDLGWTDFNIKSGSSFFKNGRIIKKTQSYVKDIPAILNKLNNDLNNYLKINSGKE
ncbi:hypothetical protein [Hyunsoonleella aestuarii]|uniref:DUF4468 domain-containing protein n=1 Tax=Hyunsoonleella aestuarii TaxID=912802 RepID=A0ABP8E775_9FLAO|nr:hypothetical protein [Hyunsoonleella aestuarii]